MDTPVANPTGMVQTNYLTCFTQTLQSAKTEESCLEVLCLRSSRAKAFRLKSKSMTTKEFYAHALLAAFPIADAVTKSSESQTKDGIASLAHDYAVALTAVFTRNRKTFQEES